MPVGDDVDVYVDVTLGVAVRLGVFVGLGDRVIVLEGVPVVVPERLGVCVFDGVLL